MHWIRSIGRLVAGLHPVVKDTALALVLAVSLFIDLARQELPAGSVFREADPLGYVLVVLLVMPLAVRRLYPMTVMVTILIAATVTFIVPYRPTSFGFGLIIATYTVARWCPRPTSWVAFVAGQTFAVAVKVRLLAAGVDIEWFNWPIDAVYFGAGWFLGDSIRTRFRYAAELEANREELARQAIVAERARVARELHDSVGHSVSVMIVHAGAAEAVFHSDPEGARRAVRSIGTVGRSTLAEMDRVLDVLRATDEDDGADATSPSLAHLDSLIDEYRHLGLEVDVSVRGKSVPLPPRLDLPAFRIVQEALTNTLKHAGTNHADVTITYSPRHLDLEICDDGSGAPRLKAKGRPRAGRGLLGMRERVAMLDGHFEAGPNPDGGFVVSARLPIATGGSTK